MILTFWELKPCWNCQLAKEKRWNFLKKAECDSTHRLRWEDHEFKASLSNTERLYFSSLKRKKESWVFWAHAFNSSIWGQGAEAPPWVWGQPDLQNKFQDSQTYIEKHSLKKPKPNQTKTLERNGRFKIFKNYHRQILGILWFDRFTVTNVTAKTDRIIYTFSI